MVLGPAFDVDSASQFDSEGSNFDPLFDFDPEWTHSDPESCFWIIIVIYIIQEFFSRRPYISAQVFIFCLNHLTLAFMRSTSWFMVTKQVGSNANYLIWYLVLSLIAYYSTSSTTLSCAYVTRWSNVIGSIWGCYLIFMGRLVRSFVYSYSYNTFWCYVTLLLPLCAMFTNIGCFFLNVLKLSVL